MCKKEWHDMRACDQIRSDPARRILESAMIGVDLDLFNQYIANSDLTQEQWKSVAAQLVKKLVSCAEIAEDIEIMLNKLCADKVYCLTADMRLEVFGLGR